MKTLVIGGTGTVGSQVVQDLLKKGVDVRVMTRSEGHFGTLPKGVEGFVGDLADLDTTQAAFEGVDNLFFLIPVSPDETELGINAVNAAVDAELTKIVYMSVAMPEGSETISHFASKIPIEQAVERSGIEYTILRPSNFYQNDIWVRDAILSYGVYPQPIGNIGINRVDVRDIADAAVIALTEPGNNGKIYNICGPEPLTGDSVAETYSRHLNREVRYMGDDLDVWSKQVSSMFPDWMIHGFSVMYQYFQQHGFPCDINQPAPMREVLLHEPRKFEDFVTETIEVWKSEGAKIL